MRHLALLFTLTACAGDPPNNPQDTPDAGPEPDAAPEVGLRVSGKTMDYFVAATPLGMASVVTDGIDPPKTAMSNDTGDYELPVMPSNSKVFLDVARTNYRTTRNVVTTIEEAPVMQDLYVLSIADVNRQYATAGVPVGAGKAFLAAELRDVNNQPLVGIAKDAIVLRDMNDQPVPGIIGPHFFGAQGDINPALLASEANGGKSRVAILDVPPGTFKLEVTYPDGNGGTTTSIVNVTATADGATLALAGGPLPGQTALDPSFAADIYPRLQKAANGGIGCANCHTTGGTGAILILDAGAQQSLANIMARPGVLDAVAPANSLLLTKPLYEQPPTPQNHPNATFLDTNDPDYKLILAWITNGAKP